MNISQAIQYGTTFLGTPFRLDVEVLLAHAAGFTREELYIKDEIDHDSLAQYKELLIKRKNGIPCAYLTHVQEFYGLPFYVDERCLIPRPETEFLVSTICDYVKEEGTIESIIDIGTGSGAIGLSIMHDLQLHFGPYRNLPHMYCSDVSEDALSVAKHNANSLKLVNIEYFCSDLLDAVSVDPHIIVTNLPYIGTEIHNYVEDAVDQYEPSSALYAGHDGLALYRRLFDQISSRDLWKKGLSLLVGEFGDTQANDMESLLTACFPRHRRYIINDLQDLPRYFVVSTNFAPSFPHNHVRQISKS